MGLKPKQKQPPNTPTKKVNPRQLHKNYMANMEEQLNKEGIVLFDEELLNVDQDFLSLPSRITEVHPKELGEYLSAFTQYKMYVRTILSRIELCIEEKKRVYTDVSNPYYREYTQSRLSERAKDQLVQSEPEVQESYYELVDYINKSNTLKSVLENIEDAIFLISREISRRTGDMKDENRQHNVGR